MLVVSAEIALIVHSGTCVISTCPIFIRALLFGSTTKQASKYLKNSKNKRCVYPLTQLSSFYLS